MKFFWNYNLVCEKVATSKLIPYFVLQSYFEHYINKGVWSSNFTLRNLCTWDELIKKVNPKRKNKSCTLLKCLPSQPTCLLN